MRILNFLLATVFLIVAFLQLNGPDPIIRILIFGSMALLSVMAIFQVYPKNILVVLILVNLLYDMDCFRQGSEIVPDIFAMLSRSGNALSDESKRSLWLLINLPVLIFYGLQALKK